VIPDTINEFPFFSFLQGDVHAHMISIAFQLLIILLLLNVMKSGAPDAASILILSLSIGFLYPLNTWDYPVYLFLAVFVIVSQFFLSKKLSFKTVKDFVILIAVIGTTAAFSYLLYFPYHASYNIDKTISFVPSGRTSLIFYLAIYGAFIYLLYSFVMLNYKKSDLKPGYYNLPLILLSIMASVVVLISAIELKSFISDNVSNPNINELELMILLVPLLILSVVSIIREMDRNRVFVLILIITGIFISIFCEFFYIKDALGSGNPTYIRLNTVFKLYLQNWVLWGASAGTIVFYFRESFTGRKAWSIVAIILILMISIYPVLATIGKSGGFGGAPTLDGEAYISREHPQDYEAILWFRNISGQPVVLQAPGDLYQWNTYVTAFTGLPTVIGWAGHEKNWRYPYGYEVDTRWSDAGTIYTSFTLDDVDALLQKYNVSYIYFGDAEIKKYSSPKLFEAHPEKFERVFEYGDVVVYKVKVRSPEK
jgi:YYY domain-containing protein